VTRRCWTLDPSQFATLWEECPRCFYLDVVRGFPRPPAAVPALAAQIGAQFRAAVEGRRTETLAPEMPGGVFELGERWIESRPLDVHLPDSVRQCLVRGRHEPVVRLDDGGWAIVDFTMSEREPERVALHARRLHAWAWAVEHPAPGALALGPVTRLGLLLFEPEKFAREAGGAGALTGGLSWIEIPRDDATLFGLLAEMLSVLDRPEPPGGAPLCEWCVYRDASRRTGL
jgi:hypothetical protein